MSCNCDCMSCVHGQHCCACRAGQVARVAIEALVTLAVAVGTTRGHAYSSSNADGGGPCSVCGYGSAAPHHQATYGLRALLVAPLRAVTV